MGGLVRWVDLENAGRGGNNLHCHCPGCLERSGASRDGEFRLVLFGVLAECT